MKTNKIAYALLFATILSSSSVMLTSCASANRQESTGQYFDSSVITTKVKSKLLADKQIKSLPITVNTYKNTVQLSGFVDTRAQKARAVDIARSVVGVNYVKDSLVVKPH